jgi:hypothetical protein
MAKQDFSAQMQGLKDMVKASPVATPMQKVVPATIAKESKKKTPLDKANSSAFTFWIDNDKLDQLKMKSITSKTSVKDLINQAVDAFLG